MNNRYYVYIIGSLSGTLYIGVTKDLMRRVYEHKHKLTPGFTSEYDVNRLLYFDETKDINRAFEREKQIKSWRREKKIALIESENPKWKDLSEGWYEESGLEKELDKE